VINELPLVEGEKINLAKPVIFEIEIPKNSAIHTIAIPFMRSENYEMAGALATIEEYKDGKYTEITKKECYMPEDIYWQEILLGNISQPEKIRVTLKAIKGTVYVASNNNEVSYKLMGFEEGQIFESEKNDENYFRSDFPFTGINIPKGEKIENIKISKKLADGSLKEMGINFIKTNEDGSISLYFEPNIAGKYLIEGLKSKKINIISINPICRNIR